jgi:glutaredoxin-like protein NrdH
MFGLSTCIHCRHTRDFLDKNHQPYTCIYVDELKGEDRSEAINEVRQVNPSLSFPTVIIDNGAEVVVGFKPDELANYLEL